MTKRTQKAKKPNRREERPCPVFFFRFLFLLFFLFFWVFVYVQSSVSQTTRPQPPSWRRPRPCGSPVARPFS